jgi:hypothetical protein
MSPLSIMHNVHMKEFHFVIVDHRIFVSSASATASGLIELPI